MADISPVISVVLPAYNAATFIQGAVDSILEQTLHDFELIIINDGSTDETADILATIKDRRVQIITQPNAGIAKALNTGIAKANTPLIARQDADDRSEPDRLQQQFDFMRSHPEVVLLGSSMQTMNMAGKILHNHYVLVSDAELKQELLVRSPFAHGSVIFRKSAFMATGGYDEKDWPAEDYGLWVRMSDQGKFANLDEPLYIYRENDRGISSLHARRQAERTSAIQRAAWSKRAALLPRSIDTKPYADKSMGQFRIARIIRNLLDGAGHGLHRGDIAYATKSLAVIATSRNLRRKCARLILMRLGMRHEF